MKIKLTLDHLPSSINAPALLNIYRQTYADESKRATIFIQNLTYDEMRMHPYWVGVVRVLGAKNTLGSFLNSYFEILKPEVLLGFTVQPLKYLNPRFWMDTFNTLSNEIHNWVSDTPDVPTAYQIMAYDIVECLEYLVRFLECALLPNYLVNLTTFEVKNIDLLDSCDS